MKRVILVFLKHPTPGRVKTRLASGLGDEGAALAYRQMVSRVLEQARSARPDVIAVAYDPPAAESEIRGWLAPYLDAFQGEVWWIPQSDGDLGHRIEAASNEVLRRYESAGVIVIGTDCVHLDRGLLDEAWSILAGGDDVVFGPTEDGGYYLLGVKQEHPCLFHAIPWSTEQTFQASLSAARSHGLKSHVLAARTDIDTIDEWQGVEAGLSGRPCVFFDRDGVVNRSPGDGYVLDVDAFELNEGIADAVRWLKDRDWLAILVTSQKGVGKGLMSRADLNEIHHYMQSELALNGAAFDGIYAYTGEADCRHLPKPDPEMINSAAESFFIDRRRSWMIGDADRDIAMGRAAGLAGTIRIRGDKEISVEADHTLDSTAGISELFGKYL